MLISLPAEEIPVALKELKLHLPEETHIVIEWLENNFVHCRIRGDLGNGVALPSPVLLLPNPWSVYEYAWNVFLCTPNHREAWHRRYGNLTGNARVSVYQVIEEF